MFIRSHSERGGTSQYYIDWFNIFTSKEKKILFIEGEKAWEHILVLNKIGIDGYFLNMEIMCVCAYVCIFFLYICIKFSFMVNGEIL